ncbi:unnamed protein product [Hymenolepis diminuta]|uniref:Uncharacterized protein n=1 Tax=Hymenolepis diminuta TaxID=6216 RepID=A0A564Z7Y8_HYMDI|nr:unnamed protein product [Hymenolepis diminuta]
MEDNPVFAKLHIRWNKLLQIAELLHFQKPMVSLLYVLCQYVLVSHKISN